MKAIVDFHIHLYSGYSMLKCIESIRVNNRIRFPDLPENTPFVLCLTEREGQHWFRELYENGHHKSMSESWTVSPLSDGISVKIEDAVGSFYFIAGRQMITVEGCELLSLCADVDVTDRSVSLRDGIKLVQQQKGIPVVPWSPGKWLKERGRLLLEVLKEKRGLYLGDIPMRCNRGWNREFFDIVQKEGLPILPGSDSLPSKNEEMVFGALSAVVDLPLESPGAELLEVVKASNLIEYPSSRLGLVSLLRRQVNFRICKVEF